VPWGTLAHSTHVAGIGTYEDGVEKLRVRVTFATRDPRSGVPGGQCRYRDPATINPADYADREA